MSEAIDQLSHSMESVQLKTTSPIFDVFHKFPLLTPELKIMIWKYASKESGVRQISTSWVPGDLLTKSEDLETFGQGHYEISCPNTPSGFYLACKLSRETILKYHTACIEFNHKRIQYNLDLDSIFLYQLSPMFGSANHSSNFTNWTTQLLPRLSPVQPFGVNYRSLFADVKPLVLPSEYANRSRSNAWVDPGMLQPIIAYFRAKFLSQFPSLETLYIIKRCTKESHHVHYGAFTHSSARDVSIYGPYNFTVAAETGQSLILLDDA